MIVSFVEPFEDEVFAGVLGRFAELMDFPSAKFTLEATLGPNAVVVYDLPSRLSEFVSRLPPRSVLTEESLLFGHTDFPLYAPFLPEAKREQLRTAMYGKFGRGIHFLIGAMADRVVSPQTLRYCTVCCAETASYWRRSHQVPGLDICARHRTRLVPSAWMRHGRNNRTTLPLPPTLREHAPTQDAEGPASLVELAADVEWLLNCNRFFPGPAQLRVAYARELYRLDLASAGGRVATRELHERFLARFSLPFLERLQCGLELHKADSSWLSRLVRAPRAVQWPVRHLLLIRLLGYSTAAFLQRLDEICSSEPPVVRPIQRLYRKDVDADRLRKLWVDRTISLREIARQFRIDPMTVKRKAVALNLPFPRQASRVTEAPPLPRRSADRVNTDRQRNRTAWLSEVQTGRRGTAEIRKIFPATYAWLYRHDREWLRSHRPKRQLRKRLRPTRDWRRRDAELSARVPCVAAAIFESGKRVTRTAIARRLSIETLVRRRRRLLPQTWRSLRQASESRVQFGLRRLNAIADQTSSPLPLWKLLREAGIREDLAADPAIKSFVQQRESGAETS